MKYDMTVPCNNCPFRKEGGIRLTDERVKEIASGMLCSQGIQFPCHKTTTEDQKSDDDRSGHFIPTDGNIACAGALIFAEKQGKATQMMRIMERLGGYDYKKLMANKEVVSQVFDNMAQMRKVNKAEQKSRRKVLSNG